MTEEEFQDYLNRVVGGCCQRYARQSSADRLYTQLVVINALKELVAIGVDLSDSFLKTIESFGQLADPQNTIQRKMRGQDD